MRKLLLLLTLTMSSYILFAQKSVSGTVKDAKTNQPLPGASVKLKGSRTGTVTTGSGAFRINASAGDVLEISMVGFKSQLVTVGNSDISVSLELGGEELSEIVFVGSRSPGRAKLETTVPVDVIKINQVGLPTAKMDLTSVLNYAAPSFNYNKQSGADGADHIDLGTL
ncbi:MAG TPA: carboxypeptidase-like regulatory domain-containing protein, partial [Puia sp.]|nr:carboxypeptidase-like regulatory domain-containing protein [Puia sp.]